MKILIASHRTYPTLGGLEKHIHTISKSISELHEKNIEILNLGFSNKKDFVESINANYRVKSIKSLFILSGSYPLPLLSGFKYFIDILKFKPDIIHAHGRYFVSTIIVFTYSLLFRKPFILTEHIEGPIYFSNKTIQGFVNFIFDIFIKILKKFNTQFSVVSMTAKEYYMENYNIDAEFIPNFINPIEIENAKSEKDPIPEVSDKYENHILYSGRLVESKGYKDLEKYVINNQKTQFIVVGEGEGESLIKRLCEKHNNIVYIKSLESLKFLKLISSVDGILMLSKQEGLSTTIMEAMALGKIVITNRLKSNLELLSKYQKKIILDSPNFEDEINSIREIKQDPYLPYTLKDSAMKYLKLYQLWK